MKLFVILLMTLSSLVNASAVCSSGLKAFSNTIHPELVKSCSQCHGLDSEAPSHSQEDPKAAYEIARELADFEQLPKSQFIKKVKSKHWLKYEPNAVGMSEEKMTELLQAWYDEGENECPTQEFAYVTNFVKVPTMNDNTSKKLSWKMKNDIFAEVEIKKYATESDGSVSFQIKKPRIGTKNNLKVAGLYLVINGEVNQLENAFLKIDQIIQGRDFDQNETIIPFSVISTETIITVPRPDSSPTLGLAFNSLEESALTQECLNTNTFDQNLYPEIKTSCLSCHGDSSSDAYKRFNLNQSVSEVCKQFSANPDIVFEVGVKGKLSHPVISNVGNANRFKRAFTLWKQ